jgi:kinesin family member 13
VIPNNPYKTPLEDFRDKKVEMVVQITNKEEGTCYIWSEVKFTNRLFIIKEYYDEFMESKILPVSLAEFILIVIM